MTAQSPDDITAQLMAEGLLDPSPVALANLAGQIVGRIHHLAYVMTVADAENLVEQSNLLYQSARKDGADAERVAELRKGLEAARVFLRFRRQLERIRA